MAESVPQGGLRGAVYRGISAIIRNRPSFEAGVDLIELSALTVVEPFDGLREAIYSGFREFQESADEGVLLSIDEVVYVNIERAHRLATSDWVAPTGRVSDSPVGSPVYSI